MQGILAQSNVVRQKVADTTRSLRTLEREGVTTRPKGPKGPPLGFKRPKGAKTAQNTAKIVQKLATKAHISTLEGTFGCGWHLRQHIGLNLRLGASNGLKTLKKRPTWPCLGALKSPTGSF